jgi:hypothetical protein
LSRPRSAPAARAGAGARPAAQRGVYVQAPKSDIYVALLGVSLGAMIIGCILLVIVLNRYGFSTKVSATTPTPSTPVVLALATGFSEKIGTVRL